MRSAATALRIAASLAAAAAAALSFALVVVHDAPAVAAIARLCGGEGDACRSAASSAWAVFPPRVGPFDGEGARPSIAGLALLHFALVGTWIALRGRVGRGLATLLAAGLAVSIGYTVLALSAAPCVLCLATHAANLVLCAAAAGLRRAETAAATPSRRRAAAQVALGLALGSGAWIAAVAVAQGRPLSASAARLSGLGDLGADMERAWLADTRFTRDDASRARFDAWLSPSDPRLPATAPSAATLVVFSDLECPACRAFDRYLLDEVLPRFDGGLTVIYKALPLTDLHPHALDAARALEAARLQGAYHELRERLLANDVDLGTLDWHAEARALGLDVERFDADRESLAVDERLSFDRKAASALGVSQTPAVFVDRRAVPPEALGLASFWERLGS